MSDTNTEYFKPRFTRQLVNYARKAFGNRRSCWQYQNRVHFGIRQLPPKYYPRYAEALEKQLDDVAGINWARLHAEWGRVIIDFDTGILTPDAIEQKLDEIESSLGIATQAFVKTRQYPGSAAEEARILMEMGIDISGIIAGMALKRVPSNRPGVWIDIAALATAIENLSELRDPIENYLGKQTTEVALSVTQSFTEAMMRGWTGSTTDLLNLAHEYKVEKKQRSGWLYWEQRLFSKEMQISNTLEPVPARPEPVPLGPIEEYAHQSSEMTIGGFGFALAATHSFEQASAALFATVPKPALHARSSYCTELKNNFARHQLLVIDDECLPLLDRIDSVIIDAQLLRNRAGMITSVRAGDSFSQEECEQRIHELFMPDHPHHLRHRAGWQLGPIQKLAMELDGEQEAWVDQQAIPEVIVLGLTYNQKPAALALVYMVSDVTAELLLNRIRASRLQLIVKTHDKDQMFWTQADEYCHPNQISKTISRLQSHGRTVMAVSSSATAELKQADIGLGIQLDRKTPPWGAQLIGKKGIADIWLVTEAIDAARKVSRQGVDFSRVESVSSLILALQDLAPQTVNRIRFASNTATQMAMLYGFYAARMIKPMPDNLQIDPTPWHALSTDDALLRLDTSWNGLSVIEAESRIDPQILAERSAMNDFLQTWIDELANPLAPVLAAGAGLSALTGAVSDAALISSVVVLNALLGSVQRYKTEQSIAELDEREQRNVRALRDGELQSIDSHLLVPGDVILLHAGEVVPADVRVLKSSTLEADESALTGESLPIKKNEKPTFAEVLAERSSMLYEGTTVAAGEVRGLVVAVNNRTESNRGLFLKNQSSAAGVEARLEKLTSLTAPVAAFSGLAVILAGIARRQPVGPLIGSGVSLAVAAVPEGLPLLANMAQLASAQRLSKAGAVVRNPRAIEAIGRMDVLCADKTGTLTEGSLKLQRVSNGFRHRLTLETDEELQQVLLAAARACPISSGEKAMAHLTDQAVIDGTNTANSELLSDNPWYGVEELPFKPERPYHAVLGHREVNKRQQWSICIKGAPEVLLPLCDRYQHEGKNVKLSEQKAEQIHQTAAELAEQGYRVLAVAQRPLRGRGKKLDRSRIEKLVFTGFVALADPVRATAKDAIAQLHQVGVNVKMITGDHPATAQAIAHQLGIDNGLRVVTGPELEALSDQQLDQQINDIAVFARVTPGQKARIVASLQRTDNVVGMTGDGANDAPAIRLADVGIALGEQSTAAARAAADLLVVDERIETIVQAALEGRAMWSSVRDAVGLLVGGNLGEIGFTLIAGLFDGRSPLNARQLLLVNLLTDSLPALAIALQRPKKLDPEILRKEGPEASLGAALSRDIEWQALITGGTASSVYAWSRMQAAPPERASTAAMLALVGSQLGQTLATGKGDKSVLMTSFGSLAALFGIVQTPGLSRVFGCTPLGPAALTQVGTAVAAATGMTFAKPWFIKAVDEASRSWQQWMESYRKGDVEMPDFSALNPEGEELLFDLDLNTDPADVE